jgi:hypothetical protein
MATVNLSLEIPDEQVQAIVKDYTDFHGYQEVLVDDEGNETPNPQSRVAFAKQCVIDHIKNSVKTRRARVAAQIAQDQALKEVEATEIS